MEGKIIAICPKCGGKIKDNGKAYGCENFDSISKTGCPVKIFKQIAGKNISISMAQELIKNGEIKNIDGFISRRTGISFSATLKFNEECSKVMLVPMDKFEGEKI